MGMTLMNMTEREYFGIHTALVAGLESRTLRPVVGKEFPLAQAAAAHEAIMSGGAMGRSC